MKQIVSRSELPSINTTPSLVVDRRPARTAATWGITGPEIERSSGAVRFMELYCRPRYGRLWLATTDKGTTRSLIADIWKRTTRLQAFYGLRPYSVAAAFTPTSRSSAIAKLYGG
jgi:hypothetical protein